MVEWVEMALTAHDGISAAQNTSALTTADNGTLTHGRFVITGDTSTTSVNTTQSAAKTETDSAAGNGQVGIANGNITITDGANGISPEFVLSRASTGFSNSR